MSYFINSEQLQAERGHVRLIDLRGSEAFEKGHIPGAVSLDVKGHFSGSPAFFPEAATLANTLGEKGMTIDTPIVLYDGGENRAAAKAFVVLHYLGHEKLQILQGGFAAWLGSNGPVSMVADTYDQADYKPNIQVNVAVELEEMKAKLNHDHTILIDSRAKKRYTGEHEPKYEKAGHIPGALNYAAKDVFTVNGSFKDKTELADHFAAVKDGKEVVVSCGTGTSACMNFVALKEAGAEDVKIYPGGFKEWIDHGNEVETGE